MLRFQKNSKTTKEREQALINAKDAISDSIAAAQECLKSPLFVKYKTDYESSEKKIVEALLIVDETIIKPEEYIFAVKCLLTEWRLLRKLLSVEKTARQKI